ncbi:MAG: SGNH/GDSL hydrolase family protein [Eubacteriales bacterium]
MNLDDYLISENEKPLDKIITDGGFTGIFRTIGCIGDSLSSGEFESTDESGTQTQYNDYFEYSWGQYIARRVGCKVYNFSCGGMTSKIYMESFAEEKGFWNEDLLCQAYIIALGVNDLFSVRNSYPLGDVSDINKDDYTKNAPTFCGWYSRIIQRLKELQPNAKFFLVSMPRQMDQNDCVRSAHAEKLYKLANYFENTYVIDLYRYAPVYDEEYKKKFYLGGHMNPMGYKLTADMMMSYIDYIIRSDPESFLQAGFIGKGVHNYRVKW